ncbi:MAG: hypothetical protein AAB896_01045 [Patescibacteria group bacterium]
MHGFDRLSNSEPGDKRIAVSTGPGVTAILTEEAFDRFTRAAYGDHCVPSPSELSRQDEVINRMIFEAGFPARQYESEITLSDLEWAALQHSTSRPPFFTLLEGPAGTTLYAMSLPHGAFRETTGQMLFTPYATFHKGEIVNSEAWFGIPTSEVHEIRGAQGGIWKQPPAAEQAA